MRQLFWKWCSSAADEVPHSPSLVSSRGGDRDLAIVLHGETMPDAVSPDGYAHATPWRWQREQRGLP